MLAVEGRLSALRDLDRDFIELLQKHAYILDKEYLEDGCEKLAMLIEDAIDTNVQIRKESIDNSPYS